MLTRWLPLMTYLINQYFTTGQSLYASQAYTGTTEDISLAPGVVSGTSAAT